MGGFQIVLVLTCWRDAFKTTTFHRDMQKCEEKRLSFSKRYY